jgi:hypothetical protein
MSNENEMSGESVNETQLNELGKDNLIAMVLSLQQEVKKKDEDFRKLINLRLYLLERNQNILNQYGRRESIVITGIPADIPHDDLEQDVIEIFKEAKVVVNRQPIKPMDISAVHRIGKAGHVICKVVNRKFAKTALQNGKNLKSCKKYGEGTRIYINENLCPEFNYLNYAVRLAKKNGDIYKYKVRNGISHIQLDEDIYEWCEIAHVQDLEKCNIPIPARRKYAK